MKQLLVVLFLVTGLVTGLVTVGCTKSGINFQNAQNTSDIFSNRPIGSTKTMVVLTLSEPALLKVATKSATGWTVPQAAKDAILKQQDQVEKDLLKISPDIKVIFRYKMVINGLAIAVESSLFPRLEKISGVKQFQVNRPMERPAAVPLNSAPSALGAVNSVNFLGVQKIRDELGFTGKGLRIGVIDTGIDYTHKMLGGTGLESDYKKINPSVADAAFPNSKVVGGADFVGSEFNGALTLEANAIPKPDVNPLDESGHGSHVAGTIGGVGDDQNTYTGVAPDAELYALKVFGKSGATGDFAVVAALDFSADPNGDMDPSDQLDVVNLSLGGGFGQPQILYSEAVKALSESGTVVVASAGNSGPKDYIVGAPGTADDAISVAASVDGSEFNWKFPASRLISPNNSNWLVKATENDISKKIPEAGDIQGELVDIGLGNTPLTPEVKAKLQGNVALISRGVIKFTEKLKFAKDNGAVGAIVSNNEPGVLQMGGDEVVDIPAIAVSQELGTKIRDEMKVGPVRLQFLTTDSILELDNIDTITDFSSKGPRSEDNLLKPEISAPGKNILSAKMGSGVGGERMDGTSMSAPHMSGVVALMKQAHPGATSAEIKALLMNTSKSLATAKGTYPLSLQGAGRVQAYEAAKAKIVVMPGGVSLGLVQVDQAKTISRKIQLKNLSDEVQELNIALPIQAGLTVVGPTSISLAPRQTVELPFEFTLLAAGSAAMTAEINAVIKFNVNGQPVAQVPVLAMQKRLSLLSIEKSVKSSGQLELNIKNAGSTPGFATVFNLLARDSRKAEALGSQKWRSRSCDLESVGYRLITKATPTGAQEVLQVALKVYAPITTWNLCELSMLIDSNGDGIAEQELASVSNSGAPTAAGAPQYASFLLDAVKTRDLRLAYEAKLQLGSTDAFDFSSAVLARAGMAQFDHSSLAVLEVNSALLQKGKDGKLHVKVAAQNPDWDAVESDDFVGPGLGDWLSLSLDAADQSVRVFSEGIGVAPGVSVPVSLQRGSGTQPVVVYFPSNSVDAKNMDQDFASEIVP